MLEHNQLDGATVVLMRGATPHNHCFLMYFNSMQVIQDHSLTSALPQRGLLERRSGRESKAFELDETGIWNNFQTTIWLYMYEYQRLASSAAMLQNMVSEL